MTISFQCPVCDKALAQHQASQGFYCENKHHFDRSELGYWVFAKPQKQKPTGDSRQLMRAKRFLLETGIFDSMVVKVAQMMAEHFSQEMTQLDYDAADGFFLRSLAQHMAAQSDSVTLQQFGAIEAENAIFAAAKAQTLAHLDLVSLKKLPYADGCFDIVTLFDKPLKGKECLRVLKDDGKLLLVIPGPRHLWQLKAMVYPELSQKPFAPNLPKSLDVIGTEEVSDSFALQGEQALTLLEMTPFAWRANDKMRHEIKSTYFDELTIDFRIVVAKKLV